MLSYIKVDGKLLLHQAWVSEMGSIDWRRVPIRGGDAPVERRERREVQVFEGDG